LDDVGDLIEDSPPQQQRLGLVRGLVEQYLVRLRAELEKAALGKVEAREVDDLAQEGRRSIGKVIQQMVNAEVALLDTRESQAERVAAIANYLGTSTLVLGLITAGLGAWLIQSQRVETRIRDMQAEFTENVRDTVIGETAVIMAHEVIQPLAATKNYLAAARRMMDRDATQPSRQSNALDQAITQLDRATEILRHLRSFGGQAGLGRSMVSIARVIEDSIAISGLDWDGATVTQRVAPGLPNILIDRVHIQQVLVNLMRNGLEAMAHSNRRELVIAAALADPGMIRVSVRDSGPGLPAEVLEKLFRPFVTTKEGGMGVGLSICRRIVEAHGGQISARNLESGGAIFEFTLPVDAST
jgi:C4-dicarboxylate-specific signal transduction histidine kinase